MQRSPTPQASQGLPVVLPPVLPPLPLEVVPTVPEVEAPLVVAGPVVVVVPLAPEAAVEPALEPAFDPALPEVEPVGWPVVALVVPLPPLPPLPPLAPVTTMHWPLIEQVWKERQLWQAAPLTPQVCAEAIWHLPCTSHQPGQLLGEQGLLQPARPPSASASTEVRVRRRVMVPPTMARTLPVPPADRDDSARAQGMVNSVTWKPDPRSPMSAWLALTVPQ